MKMKSFWIFKVWTNIFFAIPLALAIYLNVWISALILIAVIVASTLYHFENERKFAILDAIFAWILISVNLVLCYLGDFAMPYFGLTLLFVVLAICLVLIEKKKTRYNLAHGFWHVTSSLITTFSILTYHAI